MTQPKRRFVVDEQGRKHSVVLPMAEYRQLLEDLQDLALIAERRDEPTVPFETVKRQLTKKWQPVTAVGHRKEIYR